MDPFFKSFFKASIGMMIFAIITNLALLAGAVWVVVLVLKATGVLH
jgi:hypothetical protein